MTPEGRKRHLERLALTCVWTLGPAGENKFRVGQKVIATRTADEWGTTNTLKNKEVLGLPIDPNFVFVRPAYNEVLTIRSMLLCNGQAFLTFNEFSEPAPVADLNEGVFSERFFRAYDRGVTT